ncbi:MAG: HepT-like ribonuclease domain-containing protein, partial [bacterium]
IIGEAAKNLSEILKSENTEIDWQVIAGMRNVLVHEYFGIDYEIIWNVVKNKLPEYKKFS